MICSARTLLDRCDRESALKLTVNGQSALALRSTSNFINQTDCGLVGVALVGRAQQLGDALA